MVKFGCKQKKQNLIDHNQVMNSMKEVMKVQNGVNPMRISFCTSQNRENESKVPPKFLLKQSAISQQSSNTSESTSSKMNYKYQRINNTFKLVPVSSPVLEPLTSKNTLLMIHSLCERVEKLQKKHQYDEEKQMFRMRGMVEQQVQECVRKNLQKQDSLFVDRLNSTIRQVEATKIQVLQMEVQMGKLQNIQQSCGEKCQQLSNSMNITYRELSTLLHDWEHKVEENMNSYLQTLMQAKPYPLTQRLIGTPLTLFQHRSTITLQSPTLDEDVLTTYAIDEDGYLLDGELYYLVDWKGDRIKLTQQQLDHIKHLKLLS